MKVRWVTPILVVSGVGAVAFHLFYRFYYIPMTEFKTFVARLDALSSADLATDATVADLCGPLAAEAAKYSARLSTSVYGEAMNAKVIVAVALHARLLVEARGSLEVRRANEAARLSVEVVERMERDHVAGVEANAWAPARDNFARVLSAMLVAREEARAAKHHAKKKAQKVRGRERAKGERAEEVAEEAERALVGHRFAQVLSLGGCEMDEDAARAVLEDEEEERFSEFEFTFVEPEDNETTGPVTSRVALLELTDFGAHTVTSEPPRVVLRTPRGTSAAIWSVWAQYLPLPDLVVVARLRIVVVMLAHGGNFAGVVTTECGKCVHAHKTVRRYVCRKGQGGRQSSHEGRTDTVGSQMRAYHEAAFKTDVRAILVEWAEYLGRAAVVAVHSPGPANESVMFFEGGLMSRKDPRICSVPFTTHRPTMEEALRAVTVLCAVVISN